MQKAFRNVLGYVFRHWVIWMLALLILGFAMMPQFLERMFVYYPVRQLEGNPGDLGLAYRNINLQTEDGVTLHGWFVPCQGARGTLLIFHGNGGNISHRISWIEQLHSLGVNVFIIDYRGFGQSEGKPSELGLYRDARAAYGWWAREKQPKGDKLVVVGESLGGAVAIHLAARVEPAGLIVQSTFTSARDMAKIMFPFGLLLPLTNVRFDSEKEVAKVLCPKLMIHGTRDEIVPFKLGQALYQAAPMPRFFYSVPEAGHNDLLMVAGAEYNRRLKSFLARIELINAPLYP